MPTKKTKKTRHQVQANLPEPEAVVAPTTVAKPAEDKAPEAKAIEEPASSPKREFQQLWCTDEPPEGFTRWGRFERSGYRTVIAGRPLMRTLQTFERTARRNHQ